MTMKTAISIPIIATLTLLIAYFAIQQEWTLVNSVIYCYVSFVSALLLKRYLYAYFKSITNFQRIDYPLPFFRNFRLLQVNITMLEFIVLMTSIYFVYIYLQTKYWIANNFIAICLTIYAIENWLVGNMRKIYIIFAGLVLYDAFFVF